MKTIAYSGSRAGEFTVAINFSLWRTNWDQYEGFFTLDAGLLARSQYSEGPAAGHHDTGISWFLCI